MTPAKSSFMSVEKCDGLHSGDVEAFATAHVLAGQHVFATDHVGAGLGELGAIAFVGATAQLPLLGTDHPPDVVFVLLPAMGTGQRGFLSFLSLVVEFALVHRQPPVAIILQERRNSSANSRNSYAACL